MTHGFDDEMAEAELEAIRFLSKIKDHKEAIAKYEGHVKKHEWDFHPPPNTTRAAVRRASLDLTRALAKMRKGHA